MKDKLQELYNKSGTRKVLASLISILIGLVVGAIVVIAIGLSKDTITNQGMWDGVKLIFAGILSTGRNAAGNLTWGYNAQALGNMLFRATPLIMTGLSVAVAYKTGLFNIGAPGQYLMGTMASLMIALSIPTTSVPAWLVWLLAFLGRCAVGCHSRCAESAAGHQRGSGLHHDQLAGCQSCHLGLRCQQLQKHGGEHQVRLYLQDLLQRCCHSQNGAGQAVPGLSG